MLDAATQEVLADRLTKTSIVTGFGVSIVDLNLYLETATLIVGFAAGSFALFFHVRRWYRDKYLYRPTDNEVDE